MSGDQVQIQVTEVKENWRGLLRGCPPYRWDWLGENLPEKPALTFRFTSLRPLEVSGRPDEELTATVATPREERKQIPMIVGGNGTRRVELIGGGEKAPVCRYTKSRSGNNPPRRRRGVNYQRNGRILYASAADW